MVCPHAHSFALLISAYAGDQWRLVSEGVFTHALPSGVNSAVEDGFKIRLSVYPALADEVLRRLVPIVVSAGCPFKVIANTALLELAFSRVSAKDAKPDFMTVYPASQELFDELTAKLQEATQEIKNSFIPPALGKKSDRTPLTPENPWPGLDFYLANEHSYFCGREEEQLDLAQRIERSAVTVVLGQQSVGKSSLLRSGLAPAFERARFVPVHIQLQCNGEAHPLQQVRDEVNRVLRESQIEGAPFGEGQSLREYFNQPEPFWIAADKKSVVPILIFDQFEDAMKVDSPGPAIARQFEVFWTQLANLVENRNREGIGQLKRANTSAERLGCKIVISLRQDHLPQLLARGGQFPSITRNHLSIPPLHGEKAAGAVLATGRNLLDQTNPESIAAKIVHRIAREFPAETETTISSEASEHLENLRVEPALFSFFLQQLNEARKRSAGAKLITAQLVEAESERIIEDFFRRTGKVRTAAPIVRKQIPEKKASQAPVETPSPAPSVELPPLAPSLVQAETKATLVLPEQKEVAETTPSVSNPVLAQKEPQPKPSEPATAVLEKRQEPVEAKAPAAVLEPLEKQALPVQAAPQKPKVEPEPKFSAPVPKYPSKEDLLARLERQRREKSRPDTNSAPVPVFHIEPQPSEKSFLPTASPSDGQLVKRLRILAFGLAALLAVFLGVLVILYIQQVQKQQAELALQEYVSNLATTKNTFKSVNKKLTLAEIDIALKETSLKALAKETQEKEAEALAAKQQNLKLEDEQTNSQARINELNREKTQAEARLAQWKGLVDELTNQIATLSKQKQEQPMSKVITVTNRVTVTNFVENLAPSTNAANDSQEAAIMENLPVKLPATAISSSPRQVDVLLTNGTCLYSQDGITFHKLRGRDVIFEGSVISTDPSGWCDLFLRRTGTTVRVGPDSQIKLLKLSQESQNGVTVMETLLELRAGRIFTVARALVPGSTLEITDVAGHSVIETGGLGCYMISAPTNSSDKLSLTPLRVVSQIGTSIIAPGQSYSAKDSAALSLVPSSWETMLIQLDELEAETDKAIAEPQHSASAKQK
jgi:hypothetical protein